VLMNYELSAVKVFGLHGVNDFERERGQHFFIDLSYAADWDDSDELSGAVSYADVLATIEAAVKAEPVNLIETLAARILDWVFALDPRIQRAQVTVHKPSAPVDQQVADISVSMAGERG
jgi:7,8-dihydroneopterin aldolase/epimerase/oxygenase